MATPLTEDVQKSKARGRSSESVMVRPGIASGQYQLLKFCKNKSRGTNTVERFYKLDDDHDSQSDKK